MFRIRFHLGVGEHFKHWQIKDMKTKDVLFINPHEFSLLINGAELVNYRWVAENIFSGQTHKTVCSWIACDGYTIVDKPECNLLDEDELRYNPRVNPYWTNTIDENLDGNSYSLLITNGNKVYNVV